jgi:hypothetical protein
MTSLTIQRKKIEFESDDDEKDCKCVVPNCKNVKSKIGNKSFCKKHNQKFKYDKPDDCPICTESLKDEKYPLINCGHWIHHSCVIESGKAECPVCRAAVALTRGLKKELTKKSKQMKNEREIEEFEEIREMVLAEQEDNNMMLYRVFRDIYHNGHSDEDINELLEHDIYTHMEHIDDYIVSEYRENVERDLRRLSRDRNDISKRNTAKMLIIMLNNNEEFLSTFFREQNDEITTLMIESIIKSEWQAYKFVKRNIMNLNY